MKPLEDVVVDRFLGVYGTQNLKITGKIIAGPIDANIGSFVDVYLETHSTALVIG